MTNSRRTGIACIALVCAFCFAASVSITDSVADSTTAMIVNARDSTSRLSATDPPPAFSYRGLVQQSTATVLVDCSKGHSINSALAQHPQARELVVEISGMCVENVVVTRDRVTLRGTDPANDGIEALLNADIANVAVWVREAQLVTIENLKLTGGFSGLLATNVTLTNLRVINCLLNDNRAYGAQLQNALIEAEDTTFSSNGNNNAGIFSGSRIQCTRCTFADPDGTGPLGNLRNNILAFTANRVLLFQSTLTNGGIVSDDSLILMTDSTVAAFVPGGLSVNAFGSSAVSMTRVQVSGNMIFTQGANAQLLGVTQTSGLNSIDDSAFLRIGDASPATGGPPSIPSALRGFNLRNFAKATLLQTSMITGNLNCGQGADAFCTTPSNVSGVSNCSQCPNP
ncbi:MAG TPA: right-handed parallel beta-helix repeat-containing protein [Pyrinomonadaceae bacterium]|nr:right-handed parallel beta-helix repeat-containing protein [Pyrinomonadaceae bacterium]